MKAATVLLAVLTLAVHAWGQGTTLYSIGQPTDEEQLYLEMINRARANPTAEGVLLANSTDPEVLNAIDGFEVDLELMLAEFAAIPVRPPLAMNAKLLQMARGHTQDMLVHALQQHVSSNGDTMLDRAIAAGYNVNSLGENVYSNAFNVFHGHAGFQIDWGNDPPPFDDNDGMQDGRGHRVNIHENYREIGVGVIYGANTANGKTVGPQLVTQNFGTQNASLAYVTGVAFYDLNGNNFYDLGEGVGGLTVNVAGSSFHAVTGNSGGYAVPVPTADMTRAVTFTGLGLNGGSDAIITGGKNVKVDFKPTFTPTVLNGPASAVAETPTVYTFNAVGGATGYEWQAAKLNALAVDGAESLDRVIVGTTGSYTPRSTTVKHAGSSAYRLSHSTGALSSERLTYSQTLLVQADASLSFRSRLRTASVDQIAKVQVSTDNGTNWTDVYTQPGATPPGDFGLPGEATFQLRQVSLADFAGMPIQLRFSYDFSGGSFFPGTGDGVGWYIDEVTFTNVVGQDEAVVIEVEAGGTEFELNAPEAGDYLLAVRPIISNRAWAYGESMIVAVDRPAVDIKVKDTDDLALVSGVSSLNLATTAMGSSSTTALTLVNIGANPLMNLAVSVEGTHEDDFVPVDLEADNLPVDGEMTLTVQFAPTGIGNRTAVLKIHSNDPNENPFLVTLTGSGTQGLTITQPPQPQVVRLGQPVVFDVTAGPPGLTYQWKKNNADIKGATSATYTIPQAKLTDIGAYSVKVTGGIPETSQTTAAANLGVVEDIEKTIIVQEGKSITLTAKTAGANLKWEWKRNGESLEDSDLILGRETKTLTLKGVQTAQSGTYTCEVKTGDSDPTPGATTHVRIFNQKPVLTTEQEMEDGIVGGAYYHKIKVDEAFAKTPITYIAKNLPPGLKLNAKTGEITGRPTKAELSRTITLSAKNVFLSTEVSDTIIIHGYPENLAGNYVGHLTRNQDLNQGLGGRLDLSVTTAGGYSGTLLMGTLKMPFKGSLDLLADGSELPQAEIEIQPPDKSAKMKLVFVVDHENHKLTDDSKVTRGAQEAAITAWHQKWNAKTDKASAYIGLHTFGLRLTMDGGLIDDDDVPQGWGYGSFTPGLDGKISVAGRTSDGEKFTTASFVGPAGQILIYQTLYTTADKGSLLGMMILNPGNLLNLADTSDNTLTGNLTWTRPKNLAVKARTYTAGFGLADTPVTSPVPLQAVGARWMPPVGMDAVILGLNAGLDNAQVAFSFAGIDSVANDPDQVLNIGVKSKITPFAPASNPAATKLSANLKTGLLSGGFTMLDADLRPGFTKPFKRSVVLQGMLIHDGVGHKGVGYFLLPELPTVSVPLNTTILSGKMELVPK